MRPQAPAQRLRPWGRKRVHVMQKAEVVTGWIEGLGPEKHWRLMVAVLTLLFTLGVLMGSLGVRFDGDAAAGPGAAVPRARSSTGPQP